uniref:Uncharacterized protein n=1 Tax=Zea mays TaxID=4577 RepID=C4J3P1_MAIZE|nr:unknown [Zea mays]
MAKLTLSSSTRYGRRCTCSRHVANGARKHGRGRKQPYSTRYTSRGRRRRLSFATPAARMTAMSTWTGRAAPRLPTTSSMLNAGHARRSAAATIDATATMARNLFTKAAYQGLRSLAIVACLARVYGERSLVRYV